MGMHMHSCVLVHICTHTAVAKARMHTWVCMHTHKTGEWEQECTHVLCTYTQSRRDTRNVNRDR